MHALVVTPGQAGSMRLEPAPPLRAEPGQVSVRTLLLGVCGTDREIADGLLGSAPPGHDRLVIGHEVLGRLEFAGGGLKAGQLVAATVRRRCLGCADRCPEGSFDSCHTGTAPERGVNALHGFGAERFAEWPHNLVPIPNSLGRLGVFAEPMSVCQRGIRHALAIGHRQPWDPKRALVLGAGAIGLLSAVALRLRGFEVWVASRGARRSPKAETVEAVGARYLSTSATPVAAIAAEVAPDLVIEATGAREVISASLATPARNGVVCLLGVDAAAGSVDIDARLFGLDYVATNRVVFGSVNAARQDWTAGVDALRDAADRWREPLEAAIGLEASPDRHGDALAFAGVKATIRFDEEGST